MSTAQWALLALLPVVVGVGFFTSVWSRRELVGRDVSAPFTAMITAVVASGTWALLSQ